MRLIDADAAIASIEKRERLMVVNEDGEILVSTDAFMDFLKNRETVDPVRHGKWIQKEIITPCSEADDDSTRYICPNCSASFQCRDMDFKYCPYCGLLMDGE